MAIRVYDAARSGYCQRSPKAIGQRVRDERRDLGPCQSEDSLAIASRHQDRGRRDWRAESHGASPSGLFAMAALSSSTEPRLSGSPPTALSRVPRATPNQAAVCTDELDETACRSASLSAVVNVRSWPARCRMGTKLEGTDRRGRGRARGGRGSRSCGSRRFLGRGARQKGAFTAEGTLRL